MIKKYSITKEKYLELYPTPYFMRSDFRIREGTSFNLGSSSFPDKKSYKLKRWTPGQISASSVLNRSRLGFYEFTELQALHEYRWLYLPEEYLTIEETPGPIEVLKPVLDKFMSGRYLIAPAHDSGGGESEYLYLYYPEFTITNTLGESHLIKDMVVRLTFTENGLKPILQGKRFSFTKQELGLGYTHSHLHTSQAGASNFDTFCLGDSSVFKEYIRSLEGACTTIQFEMLLMQIEEYLVWESIEGRPYISISKFFMNESTDTLSTISSPNKTLIAKKFIENLKPSMLFLIDDVTYALNPGTKAAELFELEMQITDQAFKDQVIAMNQLYDFDIESNTYEASSNRWDNQLLPSRALTTGESYPPILEAFKITPSLYETKKLERRSTLIKRLGQTDLTGIFIIVNELLTKGQKFNGQNSVAEASKDISNREATVTGDSTAQPVPF